MNDHTRDLNNKHSLLYEFLLFTLNVIELPINPAIVFDIDNTLIDTKGKCIDQIINFYNYVKI